MGSTQGTKTASAVRDIFRRKLPVPPALAAFDSEDGEELFMKALEKGTMKCFFSLIQQYRTQDEPAFCGISTLVMVLNTLCIDPKRVWKGVWRWYHEKMLNCCSPLEQVKKEGINVFEFKCLATCNGLDPKLFVNSFDDPGSLVKFRQTVLECSKSPSSRKVLVVSYSRKEFGQTGDGHFSPIGGYCEEEDAILVLDVARFKYPAHWVKVEDMWKAMQRKDPSTDKSRGYFVFVPAEYHSTLLSMLKREFWEDISTFFSLLKTTKCSGDMCLNPAASFVELTPVHLLERMKSFEMQNEHECLAFCDQNQSAVLDRMLKEMKQLKVYRIIAKELAKTKSEKAAFCVTALFLAFPFPTKFCAQFCEFEELQDISQCSVEFTTEIGVINKQIAALLEFKLETLEDVASCPCGQSS